MGLTRACLHYARYIFRHKWYVFLECCKLGIPWLGIIHDWGKFTPIEFLAHIHYYYDTDGNYIAKDEELDFAWLLHQRRHKHHWQWWVFIGKNGEVKSMEMQDKYRREMLADWRGACKAQGRQQDIATWYKQRADEEMKLHPLTREWIEAQIDERG